MGRIRNLWVFLGLLLFTVSVCDFHVNADVTPSESECRPYIEKAIHELKNVEVTGSDDKESTENDSIDNEAVPETGTENDDNDSAEDNAGKSLEGEKDDDDDDKPSQENQTEENDSKEDAAQEQSNDSLQDTDSKQDDNDDSKEQNDTDDSKEVKTDSDGIDDNNDSKEKQEDDDGNDSKEGDSQEKDDDKDSKENEADDDNDSTQTKEDADGNESEQAADESKEEGTDAADNDSVEDGENQTAETDDDGDSKDEDDATTVEAKDEDSKEDSSENDSPNAQNDTKEESAEEIVRAKRSTPTEAENDDQSDEQKDDSAQKDDDLSKEADNDSKTDDNDSKADDDNDSKADDNDSKEDTTAESKDDDDNDSKEGDEDSNENATVESKDDDSKENDDDDDDDDNDSRDSMAEDDLTMEFEIPKNLRPRGHVSDLLGLDVESSIKENALRRTGDIVLKDLKRIFDNAIKPLETMYKYRDLSNRHFGDPEIFSKPLVLFMGPWSGGKSTILNYLTENEYTPNSIRSGAEPSPAYFNILMHGDEPEVLDGTQLAADWTFSGLQKFGQGLMDRLRGQKLPSKLLERVNIVEIPGILEVRKQVSRYFPFNDACQWFIDRADIIFLVYDPSKLDVGPETEAILDQLKGREYQTRILLNKADQVKPEELLRVQGALIWNISPLMSSAQPPVMYTVSLWSHPFENGAPVRLLQAQERAFLTDLRVAIDKRIENKIASARRFAVRIRNHAKMVDCYLTTYYNQKGLFSNKKHVSDKIIEHPQNYNIYEGLSTLTNISRYDLPDPEVYLDFFRLNPLYNFKKLSETCTYFKGCPINKLDIAIAYELPELVGKYKKLFEQNLIELRKEYDENCNQTEPEPPVKIIKSR